MVSGLPGYQHPATVDFTNVLATFLAAPPSKRIIERLCLKFTLTRSNYVQRIGALVGDAVDTGRVKNVELEILTEKERESSGEARAMLGYGPTATASRPSCRIAPARSGRSRGSPCRTCWLPDPDVVNNLVRGCNALEYLSTLFCGFVPETVLTIDAPESRLKTLLCDRCNVAGVELVQAPNLVGFRCDWFFDDSPPVSFGCTPSLKNCPCITRRSTTYGDNNVKWKLSNLLVNAGQIDTGKVRIYVH